MQRIASSHSYRKASVGFKREARLAGSRPNKIPTISDTPNATTTDVSETGMRKASVNSATLNGMATPISKQTNQEVRMPEVYIHAVEGRTLEQKRALVKDVTDAVVRHFKVEADAVMVQIMESPKTSKAKGGVLFSDR